MPSPRVGCVSYLKIGTKIKLTLQYKKSLAYPCNVMGGLKVTKLGKSSVRYEGTTSTLILYSVQVLKKNCMAKERDSFFSIFMLLRSLFSSRKACYREKRDCVGNTFCCHRRQCQNRVDSTLTSRLFVSVAIQSFFSILSMFLLFSSGRTYNHICLDFAFDGDMHLLSS